MTARSVLAGLLVVAASTSSTRGASTVLHLHQVPMFAYILEGVLAVDYEGVGERRYRKGDTFVEAIDSAHRGRNVGKKDVRILVVYAGAPGTPNSEVVGD
jgi:quercetin dioxygenase-like cupin family protein